MTTSTFPLPPDEEGHGPQPLNTVLGEGLINNTFHGPIKTAKLTNVGGDNFNGNVKITNNYGSDLRESKCTKADILAWLDAPNFREIYRSALEQRLGETGSWFMQKPEFLGWKDEQRSILWVTGIPGSGKTVLGSLVVHHLENISRDRADVGVTFAFLRYTEAQQGASILAALLSQLIVTRGKALAKVQAIYDRDPTMTQARPTVQVLQTVLADVTTDFSKVYTIIDGFDEADDAVKKELHRYLPLLGVNLLIFARPSDLYRLSTAVEISLRACAEDIDLYISERIQRDNRLASILGPRPDVEPKLREAIQSRSDGMFLVAKLQMDEIVSTSNNIHGLFEALKILPSGIEEMYRLTMNRIGRRTQADVCVAHRVLTLLLQVAKEDHANHSPRYRFPPSTEDIQYAIAANLEQRTIDRNCLTGVKLILSACCGLVVEVDTSGTVRQPRRYKTLRFIHYTTQDYLQEVDLTGWEHVPSLPDVLNLVKCLADTPADGASTIQRVDSPVGLTRPPEGERLVSETRGAAEPVGDGTQSSLLMMEGKGAQGVPAGGVSSIPDGPQTHKGAEEAGDPSPARVTLKRDAKLPPVPIEADRPGQSGHPSTVERGGVIIRARLESYSGVASFAPKGEVGTGVESKRGGGSKKAIDSNARNAPPLRRWFSSTSGPASAKKAKRRSRSAEPTIDPALLDARETDIVIPIMGAAGAGKSSFINLLLDSVGSGRERLKVGNQLASCTSDMESVVIEGQTTQGRAHFINLTDRYRLVIVDTPGFEDTTASDFQILRRIAQWLEESFRRKMILGGVIYLHDISQDRFSSMARRNLDIFSHLCGEAALDKVVLVTTRWSRQGDRDFGKREKELKDKHWRELLRGESGGAPGAKVMRLDPTKGEGKSAWKVVRHILDQLDQRLTHATLEDVLQIQDELVKKKKSIPETEAAKELREQLQAALRVQEEMLALEAEATEGDLEAEAKIREKEEKLREMHDVIQANKVSSFTRFQVFWRRLRF